VIFKTAGGMLPCMTMNVVAGVGLVLFDFVILGQISVC